MLGASLSELPISEDSWANFAAEVSAWNPRVAGRWARAWDRGLRRWGIRVDIRRNGTLILQRVPCWLTPVSQRELSGEVEVSDESFFISPRRLALMGFNEELDKTDQLVRRADRGDDGSIVYSITHPPILASTGSTDVLIRGICQR